VKALARHDAITVQAGTPMIVKVKAAPGDLALLWPPCLVLA